jgi:hypothetical protein
MDSCVLLVRIIIIFVSFFGFRLSLLFWMGFAIIYVAVRLLF